MNMFSPDFLPMKTFFSYENVVISGRTRPNQAGVEKQKQPDDRNILESAVLLYKKMDLCVPVPISRFNPVS